MSIECTGALQPLHPAATSDVLQQQEKNCLKIPVIISGGCGVAQHFVDAFKKTKVEGIAAGNFFSFRDQNIHQTRSQILNNGIELRK